ncbi:MAG: tryptophan synthase subunit beta, partial [Propionibacteriaceae bacterium]|nr:tryptophan synthase subunit beta [Propionibacteriaceae bacterium]
MSLPDASGHYELFGGKYVPEALYAALAQLEAEFDKAMDDPSFWAELDDLRRNYAGRPTPLTEAKRFATHCGDATVLLKREDLNHTGSHKIN